MYIYIMIFGGEYPNLIMAHLLIADIGRQLALRWSKLDRPKVCIGQIYYCNHYPSLPLNMNGSLLVITHIFGIIIND